MTTLTELKSDISSWTGHSFADPLLSSFVRLAEASINRNVRVSQMYATDDVFAISAQRVAAPTGLLEVKRFSLATGQRLEFLPPAVFYADSRYTESGTAAVYTIEGGEFVFAPNPSADTAMLGYLKAWDALSSGGDTNWLLANHYDVYLYSALAHAFSFVQDDEQASKYRGAASDAIAALNTKDQWSSLQGNNLQKRGSGWTP